MSFRKKFLVRTAFRHKEIYSKFGCFTSTNLLTPLLLHQHPLAEFGKSMQDFYFNELIEEIVSGGK